MDLRGLSSAEANRRLAIDGPNALPGDGPRGLASIALEVVMEPMFLLLIAAVGIYVVLGDTRDATILASSIGVVLTITVLQERRTEHALAELRDLSSPRALVIRDGVERRIAGRDVVVDDLIALREGDRVPADAFVLTATALTTDESILTGESVPVEKEPDTTREPSQVYSGTLVVRGFGIARVVATGARSEIGKIGHALASLPTQATPLYRETRRFVRWLASAGVVLCAVIALVYATTRDDWLGGVLAGITVAMGVLPEEFPIVLTVFLAMGAHRLSRVGVLARRIPAVESIGAATVLAVDKTGTLTENRMRVAVLDGIERTSDLRETTTIDARERTLLMYAAAASERDAFDPMERALHDALRNHAESECVRLGSMRLAHEYDLTPELLAVTHVWSVGANEEDFEVAVKGAPETVIDLCRLDAGVRAHLLERVGRHAAQGLRTLGVARGMHRGAMPDSPRAFSLQFLGFVCLADPLRASVPAALNECSQAGIRVVMITGDHPATALAIARQAGLHVGAGVMLGSDVDELSDAKLRDRVRSVHVCARAKPTHKLRLVQALAANGDVVAMTGDGVNDAPALKAAHVGVAMGGRGTDVAREAAGLILVTDDFASLVTAVRMGRRIYDNVGHAMQYLLAVHIPIAGLGLLPVLLGWPLLLMPVHVVFLQFVIDPACALVFEADHEADDVMQRPPRRHAPMFSATMLKRSSVLGGIAFMIVLATYSAALALFEEPTARALAFSSLTWANLALIFVSRTRTQRMLAVALEPNAVFWWILVLTAVALLIAVYWSPLSTVFHFAQPTIGATTAVAVMTTVGVLFAGILVRSRWKLA